MPRKTIDAWLPYLDDVLALWTELGADFKVGSLTRAQVVTLRDDLKAALDKMNALQAQLGLAMDARDVQIAEAETFAVKFRAAVIAQFGPKSSQAGRVPRPASESGTAGSKSAATCRASEAMTNDRQSEAIF